MKHLVKLEELFLFFLSIYLFSNLEIFWWWFPALILTPDIGMLGYTIHNKVGVILYNIVHHRVVSILLFIIGGILSSQIVQLIGIILFAHSTIDRVFDYGFKYMDNFKHTHLSNVGNRAQTL